VVAMLLEEEVERLEKEVKELRRALKMHIDNCPYTSIKRIKK
jgi:HAMP domain-containing protein